MNKVAQAVLLPATHRLVSAPSKGHREKKG